MKNLKASLRKVLETKRMHRMALQRYDIRNRKGVFVEKYWECFNCPVLGERGSVEFIVTTIQDMSPAMKKLVDRIGPQLHFQGRRDR